MKLKINVDSSELNNCYLRDGELIENIKSLRTTSSIIKKSYILNLQNQITISDKIILEIRRLFEF